jgi:hypothetical protein
VFISIISEDKKICGVYEFEAPNINQFYEIYRKNEPVCSLLAIRI